MLLKEKTALITGSNRGIGRAIMEVFSKNGANVFAHARKHTVEFEILCRQLSQENNVEIMPVYFDMADSEQIKAGFKQITQTKRQINVLVNNAGVAHGAYMQMTSIQELREVFEVNFFAHILLSQYVSKLMVRQKSGVIVNIASIAGLDGDKGTIAYGTSKSALILATSTMAKELAQYNIRVNAVAPGATNTDMVAQMERKAKDKLLEKCLMKRLCEPEEIANAVLFLASDMSSYITGQTLRVDGGLE